MRFLTTGYPWPFLQRLYRKACPYYIYTIPHKKLAYFQLPKTGCTTIKTQVFFPQLFPDAPLGNIHAQIPHYRYRIKALLPWKLREYFIFTVVRDPVERFISLYNKSAMARNVTGQATADSSAESQRFFGEDIPGHYDIDRLIEGLTHAHICHDPHTRPQSLMLPDDLGLFDHIGVTSRMDETFRILEKALDTKLTIKQLYAWNKPPEAKKTPLKPSSYEKLRFLYKSDYELLKNYL